MTTGCLYRGSSIPESGLRRVIVLGGLGLFGRIAAEILRSWGIPVHTASRGSGAEVRVDANDTASIRAAMREGDLIIDSAGPFQTRSMALLEAATETGFDVIDLNDSLGYAERVLTLKPRFAGAGIRVLSGASTVSAVSAAVVRQSGIDNPARLTACLAPATRYTANAGAGRSIVESVGRPVRVWRDGRLSTVRGWSEPRRFSLPEPVGEICGRLFETADALHLPRIWPTLEEVTMRVDTNTPGLNAALQVAGYVPGLRAILDRQIQWGTWIARKFGAAAGGIGYEVEDKTGRVEAFAIVARANSHLTAVAPAVLAARAILNGRFQPRGLVLPDQHVEPSALFDFLQSNNIEFMEGEPC